MYEYEAIIRNLLWRNPIVTTLINPLISKATLRTAGFNRFYVILFNNNFGHGDQPFLINQLIVCLLPL